MQRQHFSKARFVITKNDMARIIVQALHFLPTLPAADDKRVQRKARLPKPELTEWHKLGLTIINDGIADGTWPKA